MATRSTTRDESNARLIHRHLKRSHAASKADICDALMLEPEHFDAAVRFSRREQGSERVTNEIITVTSAHPYLYFLAKNTDEADRYLAQRVNVIDGHLESVEYLLHKEMDKWPDHARDIQIVIRQVERARVDLQTLYA